MWPNRRVSAAALTLASTLLFACGGCQSSKTQVPEAAPSAQKEDLAITPIDLDAIFAGVERARDRRFEARPTLSAKQARTLAPPSVTLEGGLAVEWLVYTELFLGRPELGANPKVPALRREHVARYDASSNTIEYAAAHQDATALEAALGAAIVEALDHHDGAAPASLDQFIARRAVTHGDTAFVGALQDIDAHHIQAPTLARRPELAATTPTLAPYMSVDKEPWATIEGFTHREGLGLVSALYRSHGWGGVELATATPPTSTASVISPASWMNGMDDGAWVWSSTWETDWRRDGWSEEHRSTLGPAMILAWLAHQRDHAAALMHRKEDPVDSDGARMTYALSNSLLQILPASWEAGEWRMWRRGNDTTLIWVTQWDAPTTVSTARQVFEQALLVDPSLERSVSAQTNGLKLAVVVTTAEDIDAIELASSIAASTHVMFNEREAIKLGYKESDRERLIRGAQAMRLEASTWTDPELGLRADLDAVADWKPQLSRDGLVRWWARNEGVTVQLTTELVPPGMPDFASDSYRDQLARNLSQSLQDANIANSRQHDHDLGVVHSLELRGHINGTPRTLSLKHLRRGDVLITLSVNAPAGSETDPAELSLELLEALEATRELGDAANTKSAGNKDSGILEFKVED